MGYLKVKQEFDMWNTDVRCIHCSNNGHLTKGKVYKIKDGILTTNIGAKYYYKDIDDINRASLVNRFEEINSKGGIEMGKSKWNGKVRCLTAYNCRYLTEGKVYDIVECVLTNNLGLKAVYVNLESLNYTNKESLFEEVFDKPDKIKLLLKNEAVVSLGSIRCELYMFSEHNLLEVIKNDNLEHTVRWGKRYKTTLADIKPILDILNIEIVEEQPKYKIDVDGEYYEEELELYIKLCRTVYKNMEKLVNENNILESD